MDGPTLRNPNIWPAKLELVAVPRDLEPLNPATADNYPCAENTIEQTFLDERELGMVPSPNMKLPDFVDVTRRTFVWEPWRASRSRTRSGPSSTSQSLV